MKTFLTTSLLVLSLSLSAQINSIDTIYEKYKNKPGITSISLNTNFLKAMAFLSDDKEMEELSDKLNHIRILVAESKYTEAYNFNTELSSQLKMDDYEELMRVNSSKEKVKMLCKMEVEKLNEFLLLVEGKDENALIYFSGTFTKEDLKSMDSIVEIDQLSYLRRLEKE